MISTSMLSVGRRRSPFVDSLAAVAAIAIVAAVAAPAVAADEDLPTEVTGKAILVHPAGKAVVEAAKLLAAGELAQVKARSAQEVRDEWAAMSAAEQQEEIARTQERAPDPQAFEADIERIGVLTLYGDSATLRIPTPDDDGVSAMAFIILEGGEWKVTSGPMTFEPPPVETAPAIEGEAILEHEIGELALEYATRLEAGNIDAAIELLSGPARAKRAAESAAERTKSDEFRLQHLPPAATFAEQIRTGGQLTFAGEMAYLNVVTNVSTENPDGGTTFTSTSTFLSFELQNDEWRISD